MKKLSAIIILIALTLTISVGCSNSRPWEFKPNPPAEEIDNSGNNYAVISVRNFGEITIELYPDYAPVAVSRFSELARGGYYDGKNFHRVLADFVIQGGSYSGTGQPDPGAETFRPEPHPDMRHYYGALAMAASPAGYASDSFYIVNSKDTSAFEDMVSRIPDLEKSLNEAIPQRDDFIANYNGYVREHGEDVVVEAIKNISNYIINRTNLIEYLREATDEVKAEYSRRGGTPMLDGGYTVFGYAIGGFDVIDAISAVITYAVEDDGEESRPVEEIIIESIVIKESLD